MFLRCALWMLGVVENQTRFILPKNVMPSNSTANPNALPMLSDPLVTNLRRPEPLCKKGLFEGFCKTNRAHRDVMLTKIGGPVAGISALTSKCMRKSLDTYPFAQHQSQSDGRVGSEGSRRLRSTNAPVLIKNGKVTEYDPDVKLVLPCKIVNSSHVLFGLGCYYGHGHVLTAYHVIMDMYKSSKHAVFGKGATLLEYRAEIAAMFPYFDLGFIKLIGDTSTLGVGLQNRVSDVKGNESVYFYALNAHGQLYKKEGRVIDQNVIIPWNYAAFTISVKGNPGDSGSPVYSNGRLVGIYMGILDGMGYCSKIDPEVKRWEF